MAFLFRDRWVRRTVRRLDNRRYSRLDNLRYSRLDNLRYGGGTALVAALAVWLLMPLLSEAGSIQCANLIYGGTQTSRCFSDEFLSAAQRETTISTERRFKTVKLASDELFRYPFTVLTGEKDFHFTSDERQNLKRYLESGGFLVASAGCSNQEFDKAFRREMKAVFADRELTQIPETHILYRTVYKIEALKTKGHGTADKVSLEGLDIGGKTVLIYSKHGLNDTAHTEGCCCCGGSEIINAMEVNVNIFIYALLY